MQNMKILLALGACFGAAVVAACSSSSSGSGNPGASTDAGGGEDVTTASSGDDAQHDCLPLGGTGCAKGSACCLDTVRRDRRARQGGMCVVPGTCTEQHRGRVHAGCGLQQRPGLLRDPRRRWRRRNACRARRGRARGPRDRCLGALARRGRRRGPRRAEHQLQDVVRVQLHGQPDPGLRDGRGVRRRRAGPACPSPACWATAGATRALQALRRVSACTRPRSGATWRASRPPATPPRSRIRERWTPWHRRMLRPTRRRSEPGERGDRFARLLVYRLPARGRRGRSGWIGPGALRFSALGRG